MNSIIRRPFCGTKRLLADFADVSTAATLAGIVVRMLRDISLAELTVKWTIRVHATAIFYGLTLH